MALKSIYEIEVDDSAFKAFQAEFDDFQSKVKESSKNVGLTGDKFERLADLVEMVAYNTSQSAKSQNALRQATDGTNRSMANLARNTKDVTRGILDATTSLLKWTGIIGGIGMFGGLFGINRMIAGVVGRQAEAGGLSSRTGAVSAFHNDFGQILDAGGILSRVNAARMSADKTPFIGLGMQPGQYSGQTPDVAVNAVVALRKWLEAHPNSPSQLWEGMGFTRLFSSSDIQQIKNARNLDQLVREYKADKSSLELGAGTANAWGTLGRQFDRSEIQIGNAFASSLVKLTGPLNDLSQAIVKATRQILGSDAFKGGIEELSKGIKSFANYLISPEFSADLANFMDALGDMARGMKKFAGVMFGPSAQESFQRAEKRYGLQPGALSQIERASGAYFGTGLALKDPRSGPSAAIHDAFAANANLIGAAMTRGGPDKVHEVLSNLVSNIGLSRSQQAQAVHNMEIRIYAPAGSDVSKTVNGMAQ